MEGAYDWFAQHLTAAPLPLQLVVVLAFALPSCAVAAVVLLRVIDLAALGWQRDRRKKGEARAHGQS